MGLALAIALVSRWHVGQWQVPKAWARILLSCRAVGIVRPVVVRQPSPVPVLSSFFQGLRCLRKRLLVPVEKLNRWMSNVILLSWRICRVTRKGIVANVCVSAVVPFRSRVLSHETKRGTKIETYSLLVTAPLQKHAVGRCGLHVSLYFLFKFIHYSQNILLV